MNPFSVKALSSPVRLFQLRYPIYSPTVLCQTNIHGEYTIYKHIGEDDSVFEALSIQHDPRIYYVFMLYEDCPGIDQCGIVHYLSGLFSRASIPILYVNTYAYNLVFISDEYHQKAKEIMKSTKELIYEEEQDIDV